MSSTGCSKTHFLAVPEGPATNRHRLLTDFDNIFTGALGGPLGWQLVFAMT
jgi:hypothetical protein